MPFGGSHPETLAGIRVIDLTRLLPGPFCTTLLADLGADVIKIEAPAGGDYARWFPPQVGSGGLALGAFFASINRGKRSLTLNLKKPAGRDLLLRLVDGADVVIESFRPGVMDRLDLGLDTLQARKPDLVYCAISGFGQDGPLCNRAGHDLNYLALCGALEQNGPSDAGPHTPGFQLADIAGGSLYAALAIVSALLHRLRTGTGARLDISMTEGALTFMAPQLARVGAGLPAPERGRGQLTGGLPCYRVYATRDGRFVALAALEPKFWTGFCQAVGKPEWVSEGHSPTSSIRADIEALFLTRDRDDWADLLDEHDICCEPVLEAHEVIDSALMKARDVFFELGAPGGPSTFQTATPITPKTGRRALRPAPRLGQHSFEVLTELGLAKAEIDTLVAAGATSIPAGGGPDL